ncbi:MAG: cell division protein SepF [Clostridia bacterium]|nr:cell division protein SepF [Clostridia bacterium]
MGFFNKVLKGLGFEDDQPKQQKKVEEKQPQSEVTYNIGAQYDLSSTPVAEEKKQTKEFFPNNQIEVQKIVEYLREEDGAIVDLSGLQNSDYIRALDFLSGAVYVKNGKIQRLDSKKFLLVVNE